MYGGAVEQIDLKELSTKFKFILETKSAIELYYYPSNLKNDENEPLVDSNPPPPLLSVAYLVKIMLKSWILI